MKCRWAWTSEPITCAGIPKRWTGLSSTGELLCAHNECVESTSMQTDGIRRGRKCDRPNPHTGFPYLGSGQATVFLSIAKAQGGRMRDTMGPRGYHNPKRAQDVRLVKIAHCCGFPDE